MSQLQRLVVTPAQLQSPYLVLASEQQHYLRRVLRLQEGDRFIAMDGRGCCWLTALTADAGTAQLLEPLQVNNELPLPLVLLVALPKGGGMDDIVRQVTELGVSDIVPVISDRTLLQPSPQKLLRWQRIAQEAAEQSERQVVPCLHKPLIWAAALERWNSACACCYLCSARPPHVPLWAALSLQTETAPVAIATGPEGGWTAAEVAQAIAAGYQTVSLGRRVLRAVTAPVAAVSLVAASLEKQGSPSANLAFTNNSVDTNS